MTELRTIVYVSSAIGLMSSAELRQLLEQARRRNHARFITGALAYCDGNFIQLIEGPTTPLGEIFGDICADTRHRNLVKLFDEPTAEREFKDWAMAYSPAQGANLQHLREADRAPQSTARSGKGIRVGSELLRHLVQLHWPGVLSGLDP